MLFIAVRGQGFGAGDVKLSAQLGLFTAYLGWTVLGWAVVATAVIGGVIVLVMVLAGAANRKTEFPCGPPMILGGGLPSCWLEQEPSRSPRNRAWM